MVAKGSIDLILPIFSTRNALRFAYLVSKPSKSYVSGHSWTTFKALLINTFILINSMMFDLYCIEFKSLLHGKYAWLSFDFVYSSNIWITLYIKLVWNWSSSPWDIGFHLKIALLISALLWQFMGCRLLVVCGCSTGTITPIYNIKLIMVPKKFNPDI